MALSWMSRMLKKMSRRGSRSGRERPNRDRFLRTFEPLDDRIVHAKGKVKR
jgi:hypothetical protein